MRSRSRRGAAGSASAPFDTLNLGRLTDDDPERVGENRRRLCAEVGTDAGALSLRAAGARGGRQAGSGAPDEPGDGLWTDTPGQPLLVFTADCLPVAIVRANGGPAGGRRRFTSAGAACSAGIVANAVAALGGGTLAAAIGPGIGPCCYEVGDEVAGPFRERYGEEIVRDGRLDLWTAAERALDAAGIETSTGPTSARPATRTSSSRIGATPGVPAARG